ncbi:MAG: hypothetical protein Fur0022_04890 [Anaerolineales bacterium]
MDKLEQLARAAYQHEGLLVRSLTQDLLRETSSLQDIPRPTSQDTRLLSIAASLLELLAQRQQQAPPAWVQDIGPMPEPFYLLETALLMKHLRELCETQAPEPLKKRNLYAPPNYLAFA